MDRNRPERPTGSCKPERPACKGQKAATPSAFAVCVPLFQEIVKLNPSPGLTKLKGGETVPDPSIPVELEPECVTELMPTPSLMKKLLTCTELAPVQR